MLEGGVGRGAGRGGARGSGGGRAGEGQGGSGGRAGEGQGGSGGRAGEGQGGSGGGQGRGGPYAGHKALHTCTSWYAYAAMFGSSSIIGLGHISAMLQAHSEFNGIAMPHSLLCVYLPDCWTVFCRPQGSLNSTVQKGAPLISIPGVALEGRGGGGGKGGPEMGDNTLDKGTGRAPTKFALGKPFYVGKTRDNHFLNYVFYRIRRGLL